MNPYATEAAFVNKIDEKWFQNTKWADTRMWVEVGGLGLIICTVSIFSANSCNTGFRIVDENNTPLLPYRKSTNNRAPVHFSIEDQNLTHERLSTRTFQMIANCKYAKLQYRTSDNLSGYSGWAYINGAYHNGVPNAAWNHKPITTMSCIPLVPLYQGGDNTVFDYSKSRMQRQPDEDKSQVKYDKNKKKTPT